MKSKLVLFSLIVFHFYNSVGAQENLGSWNIINVNVKVSSKWNIFTEAQLRSLSFYDEFHYYEIKSGATYKINKDFSVTSGFGSYNTYSQGGNFNDPIQNKEIRTWAQVNLKNPLKYLTLEHRYRAEQRFTSDGYKNRFRYRIAATIPINNLKIIPKTFYTMVWNELFLTNKEPFFERNRLFVGCGYEVNKNFAVQAGYIYQYDYKINDETGRDFLNIALLYNFDLSKKTEKEFIPTTTD